MTGGPYRFGDTSSRFSYPGLWEMQRTSGPDRVALAPREGFLELLAKLTEAMAEPFGVLHVLLTSRRGNKPGRYQSAQPWGRDELLRFLQEYPGYLENDGRHHTWVMGLSDESQIIYDNHNLIYCYGSLTAFVAIAKNAGLSEGKIAVPKPHSHRYNLEFDEDEDRILKENEWKWFPLADSDDP